MLVAIMKEIQKSWENFEDPDARRLLTDALTSDILGIMFDTGSIDSESDTISSDYENLDVFDNFSFINHQMLTKYFKEPNYKLPTLTEIGLSHGGISKSGVSKKLKRFYTELKIEI